MLESDDDDTTSPNSPTLASGIIRHEAPSLTFAERRRYALIGTGLTIVAAIGLGSLNSLAAAESTWKDRIQGGATFAICLPVVLYLLKLVDGNDASLLLRTVASSPSLTRTRNALVLTAGGISTILLAAGFIGSGIALIGAASEPPLPLYVPYGALASLAVGGTIKGWTRRQGVSIEAQVARLQRKFKEASDTVEKSQKALTDTQVSLRLLAGEIERQAQGLERRHSENVQFSEQLQADPEAAKAYLQAQTTSRRRSNRFALALFVLGIAAGYLVNLTSDALGDLLQNLLS